MLELLGKFRCWKNNLALFTRSSTYNKCLKVPLGEGSSLCLLFVAIGFSSFQLVYNGFWLCFNQATSSWTSTFPFVIRISRWWISSQYCQIFTKQILFNSFYKDANMIFKSFALWFGQFIVSSFVKKINWPIRGQSYKQFTWGNFKCTTIES